MFGCGPACRLARVQRKGGSACSERVYTTNAGKRGRGWIGRSQVADFPDQRQRSGFFAIAGFLDRHCTARAAQREHLEERYRPRGSVDRQSVERRETACSWWEPPHQSARAYGWRRRWHSRRTKYSTSSNWPQAQICRHTIAPGLLSAMAGSDNSAGWSCIIAPCSRCGLPSNMMALITSGAAAKGINGDEGCLNVCERTGRTCRC